MIDARRLHGGKVKRYYLQSSLIYLPVILYVACVFAWPGSPGLALKGRRKWRSHRPCQFVLAPPVTDQRKPRGLMGDILVPTAGSLRLFKFVSDEFVTASPPACNSNYLGYMSIKVCNRKLRSIKKILLPWQNNCHAAISINVYSFPVADYSSQFAIVACPHITIPTLIIYICFNPAISTNYIDRAIFQCIIESFTSRDIFLLIHQINFP